MNTLLKDLSGKLALPVEFQLRAARGEERLPLFDLLCPRQSFRRRWLLCSSARWLAALLSISGGLGGGTAVAQEATLHRTYDRYKDKTVVEMRCHRNRLQRGKPCIAMSVGVDGKKITRRNAPGKVFNVNIHWTDSSVLIDRRCTRYVITHDKGKLVLDGMGDYRRGMYYRTTLMNITGRDRGFMTYCRLPLSKKKVECQELGLTSLSEKAPKHLLNETHAKVEFFMLPWCQIAPLKTVRRMSLNACGRKYPIKHQNTRLIRRFARMFPKPLGKDCFEGRIVPECPYPECKSLKQRTALAQKALGAIVEAAKAMGKKDCDVVAARLNQLSAKWKDVLTRYSVIKEHIPTKLLSSIQAQLRKKVPDLAKRAPCLLSRNPGVAFEEAYKRFATLLSPKR